MSEFDIHRAALEGKNHFLVQSQPQLDLTNLLPLSLISPPGQAGLISKYLSSVDSEAAKRRVNEKDADKRTPLHWSATGGKAEIVRDLLDAGADLEEKDESG